MMDERHPSRVVTLFAARACGYCGRLIPAGTRGVLAESGTHDGLYFKRYACPACRPLLPAFREWCGGRLLEDVRADFRAFKAGYGGDGR